MKTPSKRTPRDRRATAASVQPERAAGGQAARAPKSERAKVGKVGKARAAKPVAKKPKAPSQKKPSTRSRAKVLPGDTIEAIFARFQAANPEPKGELEHVNVFTLLVAVVLSAQATDAGVNKATRALFEIADTPERMVALGEEKVRDYIKTIGLFRNKAKNVIALSERLIAEHGGVVPNDRDALEKLPGVGRKTANVVMNIAFGAPTIAVDTHIFRLANRLSLAPGKTPLEVEAGLEKIVPDKYRLHCHHWLILHGRYICLARKPRCNDCIIRDLCPFEDKTPAPA